MGRVVLLLVGVLGCDPSFAPVDAPTCVGSSSEDTICFRALLSGSLTLTGVIDTDKSADCSSEARGLDACVIAADEISVDGTVVGTGSRPLALVAASRLTIAGVLDVASHRTGVVGPAADLASCSQPMFGSLGAGEAGGSFSGLGGAGGGDGQGVPGIPGSAMNATAIRGGCRGGRELLLIVEGGHGGGAVLLVAPVVVIDGIVDASGGGGDGGLDDLHGAAGGGSGGMIAIDAGQLSGGGTLVANGGGGGGGGIPGTPGGAGADPDPHSPFVFAAGGTSMGGRGGSGTADRTSDGAIGESVTGRGGGGGGGAAGVIEFYAARFTTGQLSPR